jgi:hypothetical protein
MSNPQRIFGSGEHSRLVGSPENNDFVGDSGAEVPDDLATAISRKTVKVQRPLASASLDFTQVLPNEDARKTQQRPLLYLGCTAESMLAGKIWSQANADNRDYSGLLPAYRSRLT